MKTQIVTTQNHPQSLTAGIQEAINALPASGGVVQIPAGEYLIFRSIKLKANITIQGEGRSTVITRPTEKFLDVTEDVTKNTNSFKVSNTAGVVLGHEYCIKSSDQGGWHCKHGVVSSIKGNTINLEPVFALPDIEYLSKDKIVAANWFPIFYAHEIERVSISNLAIQGNVTDRNREKTDFTVAAIHTHRCSEVVVEGIYIKDYPGDGIGIQSGTANRVSKCIIDGCIGQGLHPGTGISHSIFENNISSNNTQDGFYFCLGVNHIHCTGNHLLNNRRHGIGGLTKPDRYNIVTQNYCSKNGRHGIDAANSYYNIIENNFIDNNSQSEAGKYAGLLLTEYEGTVVRNNIFLDDQEIKTQTVHTKYTSPIGKNQIDE